MKTHSALRPAAAGRLTAIGGGRRRNCSGRGVPRLEGARPLICGQHTLGARPQNILVRASKGMTCPNLREIGSGRGRGFSLVVFPTPLLLV